MIVRLQKIYFLFPLLLCACISTNKYSAHLSEKIKPQTNDVNEWLIVKSRQDTVVGSKVEKIKYNIIPILFYWKVRRDYMHTIDEYSVATVFTNYVHGAADSLKLKESLGDKRILIEINQLPLSFLYSERKHTLFLILDIADWTKEIISPLNTELVTKVTISDNGNISSSFPLTIKNGIKEAKKVSIRKHYNYFNFIDKYLTEYDKELKRMATELVLEIKVHSY